MKLEDFSEIGVLGVGSFGVVLLERHVVTGEVHALKHVSKGLIVAKRMEGQVKNERAMMLEVGDCPFVARLRGSINTPDHLIYVMEPCLGGELFQVYKRQRLHGKQPHARFYTACIARALAFLHAKDVVYRDLKPENVLLCQTGYAKLADFGCAKRLNGITYTTCGSPSYFAPEVIAKKGYGLAVDWWTLGVLVYELFAGRTPFQADAEVKMYRSIIRGIGEAAFPRSSFSHEAEDLIKRLCARDPAKRLSAAAVESHPWFYGFDWQALRRQTLAPPFKPLVRSPSDLSNFPMPGESLFPPDKPYVDPGNDWDRDF